MSRSAIFVASLAACSSSSPSAPSPEPITPAPSQPVQEEQFSYDELAKKNDPGAPPDWPSEIPWASATELVVESLVISPAGDIVLEWTAVGAVDESLATQLLQQLASAGYEDTGTCNLVATSSCTLKRAGRAVTLLKLRKTELELHLFPANLAAAKLPGSCATPPFRARPLTIHASGIDQSGDFFQSDRAWKVETYSGADLDSDGALEVYVPSAKKGSCPWDIPYDVYVMRGMCGHRVGTIVGNVDSKTRFAAIADGLRVVTTTAEWNDRGGRDPIPVAHTRTRRYEFDGQKLREKSDSDNTGRCHHCAVLSCSPATP